MNELALMLLGGVIGKALGEKGIPSDAEVIELLRSLKPTMSTTLTLDISQVRNNEVHNIQGYAIFIQNPEDASVPVYVKLNEDDKEAINITETRRIIAPFYRFFVTNTSGTGTLTLIISKSPTFGIAEASTNVNIVAQTITNLLMTFNAQTVGIYLQPEWAVLQGIQKTFKGNASGAVFGDSAESIYTVPNNKILHVNYIGCACCATSTSDADAPQECLMFIRNFTDMIDYGIIGGDGGAFASFPAPLSFVANKEIRFTVISKTHHSVGIYVVAGGYEIDD